MHPAALPGIILTAFGPTTESGKQALDIFAGEVCRRYPGHAVHWAFTARHAAGDADMERGRSLSVRQALDLLGGCGRTRIAVQPLHVALGREHGSLCREVDAWHQQHPDIRVAVGCPLMTDEPSILAVLAAMREAEEEVQRHEPDETVVWVCHGSEPPYDRPYLRLATLAAQQEPPMYVGCLLGGHDAAAIRDILLRAGRTSVCLMPFFALAGHHVRHDMAGKGSRTWKSVFETAGIACRIVPHGLVRQTPFTALWLARLQKAIARCTHAQGTPAPL